MSNYQKSIPSQREIYTRFSKSTILQVVKEIENGSISRKEACNRYGMAYVTLCDWINKYDSDTILTPPRSSFSPRQKRIIVKAIQEAKLSVKEANLRYKISGKDTVKRWLREAKAADNSELVSSKLLPMKVKSQLPPVANNQDKELLEAKWKIQALETLIDIAEGQFKINIRKKPGAKQSSK